MSKDSSWEEQHMHKREERRQAFLRQVQDLAERINASGDSDEMLSELSRDVCFLFGCDRMTLYAVSATRTAIEVKLKTGLTAIKNFALPISSNSVAGYTALTKRPFNIRNVYDRNELQMHSSELRFFDKVDQSTGYRAKEMLTVPVANPETGELLGVLQLINNRMGGPFSALIEEGARELCKSLAVAFEQRAPKAEVTIQSRFDPLVVLGALAMPELALAKRSARRKQLDLEDVLIDEFQVKPADLGAAFSEFFGVPYEPYRADRPRPAKLLQNFKRDYAENNGWLPLEENRNTLTILSLDPEQLRATSTVGDLFSGYDVDYRVTTRREFHQMIEHLYGPSVEAEAERASNEAALDRIHRIICEALASSAPELHAALRPEFSKVVRNGASNPGQPEDAQVSITFNVKLPSGISNGCTPLTSPTPSKMAK